jgi:DNA mismatch endonuclease (patch repair protein)
VQQPPRAQRSGTVAVSRRKAPSFKGFSSSSRAASRVKSRNRATNTVAEMELRRALWKLGARYRTHALELPGKPDIVFRRTRIAVFCDGDFWHGRSWRSRRAKLLRGSNADYWVQKIRANIARDRRHTRVLTANGWLVLRYWESDILADPTAVARLVVTAARRRKRSAG